MTVIPPASTCILEFSVTTKNGSQLGPQFRYDEGLKRLTWVGTTEPDFSDIEMSVQVGFRGYDTAASINFSIVRVQSQEITIDRLDLMAISSLENVNFDELLSETYEWYAR